MKEKHKNWIIALLCAVIAAALILSVYQISRRSQSDGGVNPNVTVVTAPEQAGFEPHPEWVTPEPEVIDYGENLALGKDVAQNGQTQVYHCKNAVDGNRFTYWEGKADAYPSELTVDLGEVTALSGAQVLLSPNQIWSARTQEIEILLSDDGEQFTTVAPREERSFDPAENNSAYISFPADTQGRYVRFCFYSNTEATAGQAAEIEIYGV